MTDWPQIVPRLRVLDNQRKPLRERSKKKPSAQERREGNNKKHLALIRLLPCCVTLKMPAGEAHHLKSGPAAKERGVGMKATDKWAVPLGHKSHMYGVELLGSRNEFGWFQSHGIDPYELAAALWAATGDLPKMTKIVLAHRAGKRRGGGDG